MIVLEKELSKPYEMIDMVTTPRRKPRSYGALQQLHFRPQCLDQYFQRIPGTDGYPP